MQQISGHSQGLIIAGLLVVLSILVGMNWSARADRYSQGQIENGAGADTERVGGTTNRELEASSFLELEQLPILAPAPSPVEIPASAPNMDAVIGAPILAPAPPIVDLDEMSASAPGMDAASSLDEMLASAPSMDASSQALESESNLLSSSLSLESEGNSSSSLFQEKDPTLTRAPAN
eukprot:gnl/MRDRNA2_/MRDRNA2_101323_c0_seq1.p1 gnl/MRDRNA2_/MRDRNA2_101323_c0~~gnl/MRDRNA2_/MRDRNA2_101323_c0_seq1.p1  ORF type:complete len:178 (+),score=36.41 gnl/MRDRNA2_/MRDRNA2_101323_c0_seq1:112-645(+)